MTSPPIGGPIWRVLVGEGDDEVGVLDVSSLAGWEEARTRLDPARPGMVVIVDRRIPSLLRGLVKRDGLPSSLRGVRIRRVIGDLGEDGFEVAERYRVWASAAIQRIAVPVGSMRPFLWVHRSGVLGGGGELVFTRWLVRSRPVTRLLWWLAPAVALVVTRRSADG